jgi:eukaryotic-like serine/threonine-protein kinase
MPDSGSNSTTIVHNPSAAPGSFIGSLLNKRYYVENELKRGGFGIVYLARDLQLHSRPVVVKVLLDRSQENEYVVKKFHQEIEALSRIDHPGVVGIIDSGQLDDGKPFIVMQYVDGVTLRSLISDDGMELRRAGEMVRQIGRALTAAHEKGIFHRDLKPENIMVQTLGPDDEQVKVIDFGIAKIKNSAIAAETAMNVTAGTISYMAPEQLTGRPITALTDVFALGEICYEMLTGRKPFNPETAFELLELQRAGVSEAPSQLRAAIPFDASVSILKALSFEPESRHSSARQFGDELSRILSNASVDRPTPSPAPAVAKTELSPISEPLADVHAVGVETMAATFPITVPGAGGTETVRTPAKTSSASKVAYIVGIILLTVGAIGTWLAYKKFSKQPAVSITTASPVLRTFSYWLTVQKMRNDQPYQNEFESSGQEIFENGWKFLVNINSPENGYLYILNEGLDDDGQTTLNVLFPSPSGNAGNALVEANKIVKTGWMRFDQNQGTEKFYLVWAAQPVKELEDIKGAANSADKGTVHPVAASTAKVFLQSPLNEKPSVVKDSVNKRSVVTAKSGVIVNMIELEHH